MRIRVIQKPPVDCIDGIRLSHFLPGQEYDVGSSLGSLLLAERWAEPVATEEPALTNVIVEPDDHVSHAPLANLIREIYPPYYDGPSSLAADRRKKRRPRGGGRR